MAAKGASIASKSAVKGPQKTYTITFGDVAENHARMQKIGTLHENGYSLETLQKVHEQLTSEGVTCELYALHQYVDIEVEEAYVLVMRKGVQHRPRASSENVQRVFAGQ